jgi:hypothetical protein
MARLPYLEVDGEASYQQNPIFFRFLSAAR